jgi:hypothetical protein
MKYLAIVHWLEPGALAVKALSIVTRFFFHTGVQVWTKGITVNRERPENVGADLLLPEGTRFLLLK